VEVSIVEILTRLQQMIVNNICKKFCSGGFLDWRGGEDEIGFGAKFSNENKSFKTFSLQLTSNPGTGASCFIKLFKTVINAVPQ